MLDAVKNQLLSVFPDVDFSFQQGEKKVTVQMFQKQDPVSRFTLYEGGNCIGIGFHNIFTMKEHFFFEQCINPLFDLLEEIGKRYHKKTVQFLYEINTRVTAWSEWLNPIFKKRSFIDCRKINTLNNHLLEHMELVAVSTSFSWIKELIPNAIPTLFESSKLVNQVQTIQVSHPTFYTWELGRDLICIYYNGYEGVLAPVLEQEKFSIVNEDFSFSVSLDFLLNDSSCLLPLLQHIEKRTRLENVFNPPMFHIKRQLQRLLGSVHRVEELHSYLLNLYEGDDIELFFATKFSSYPYIGNKNDDLFVFYFLDSFFLLDFREETSFYVANDLQTIQQEYTRRLFSPFMERDMANKVEF